MDSHVSLTEGEKASNLEDVVWANVVQLDEIEDLAKEGVKRQGLAPLNKGGEQHAHIALAWDFPCH
jgi:hypothetical protein